MKLSALGCSLAALLLAACPGPAPKDDAGTPDAGSHPKEDAGQSVEPITVTGHVSTYGFNEPYGGATVTLGSQSTTTDASGTFAFQNVTPPYDVTVTSEYNGITTVETYAGLTRADPSIELKDGFSPEANRKLAIVSGTITGVTFPLPAGHEIRVITASNTGGTQVTKLSSGAANGNFAIAAQWRGSEDTHTANIYAFEYTLDAAAPKLPTAFGGYGVATVSLTNGVSVSGQNIALTAPATGVVSVNVTQSTPAQTLEANVGVYLEPNVTLFFAGNVTGNFSATLPHIPGTPGAFAGYQATFSGGDRVNLRYATGLTPPATVNLDTLGPLQLTPGVASDYAPGMTFSWSGAPGAVYRFTFSDTAANKQIVYNTTATQAQLPAGYAPASGTAGWYVSALPDVTKTDDVAVPRFWSSLFQQNYVISFVDLTVP